MLVYDFAKNTRRITLDPVVVDKCRPSVCTVTTKVVFLYLWSGVIHHIRFHRTLSGIAKMNLFILKFSTAQAS